jgi:copper chaperone CopZ
MIITHYPVTPVLMYGHCEASVRNEVSAVVGVDTVALSAAAGTFTVTSTAELVQAQIIVARDAGYTAEPEPASSPDA